MYETNFNIMQKKLLFLIVIFLILFAFRSEAFTTSSTGYVNNNAPAANFIVSTDNNLVLDITLPDPGAATDTVSSIIINNVASDGPAADNEISAIKVWQEDGSATGFQPGSDTLIGSKTSAPYLGQTMTCSSAPVYTSSSKNRIYVTINISPKAINRRVMKASIPVNGLNFVSTSNGPTDVAIINQNFQTILTGSTIDNIRPTSNIDNLTASSTITVGQSYTITGISADTGGSNVKSVEISFNNGTNWSETTPLIAQNNGYTWKYIWSNISAGVYSLKTRATDWIGNVEIPNTGIVLTVNTNLPPQLKLVAFPGTEDGVATIVVPLSLNRSVTAPAARE